MNPTSVTYEQAIANTKDPAVLANLQNAYRVNPTQFAPSTFPSTVSTNAFGSQPITLPTQAITSSLPMSQYNTSTLANAQTLSSQPEPTQVKSEYQKVAESMGLTAPKSLEQAYQETQGSAELVQKKALATQLQNEMTLADKAFRTRVDEIKANPSGQFGGAVNQELRQAQYEHDSNMADKAIRYNMALGDYQAAKEGVDTLFQLKAKDIENQYNYKKELVQSVYSEATKAEQKKLDAIQKKADQDFQLKRDSLGFERDKYLKQMGISADLAKAKMESAGGVQTLTGKPQNASQATANSYANRINEANVIINNLGGKFTGKLALGGLLPNALQSGDRQAYEQAKNNFVTAVLRRESGASIAPTEFSTAEKQYFPQPGDKPTTVAQKEVARNTVINNFYSEANVSRPVMPNDIIQSGGKRYKVGSDGQTLTELK